MAVCGIRASKLLFNKLLLAILQASMSFHETVPRGRVLNRFSEDLSELDDIVPFTLRSMVNVVLLYVGSLGLIVFTTPLFATVIPAMAVFYYFIQVFYLLSIKFYLKGNVY